MKNNSNETFLSTILIFMLMSLSLSSWLMVVYFIKYNIPAILGSEWYPIIILAMPIFILFLILLVIFFLLYGNHTLKFIYIPLSIILILFVLSNIFPTYKYSPQRMVLRFTGMGGKNVLYILHKYGKNELINRSSNIRKHYHKAYLIYTGDYFYYFATKNKVVGINKEICHISGDVNIL